MLNSDKEEETKSENLVPPAVLVRFRGSLPERHNYLHDSNFSDQASSQA